MARVTTEEFIEKARKIHGEKYDYSKVVYTNNQTKVEIICHIHGSFWQRPNNHLQGQGCGICAKKDRTNTTEKFIEKAKEVHNNFYNYSKVVYVNNKTKVEIICPIHGVFWQKPSDHLRRNKCPICAVEKLKLTKKEFIEKAKKVHGNAYDYSKVNYKNNKTKVEIVCPEHGSFWQTPGNHLQKYGCPSCANVKRLTKKEFIEKAKKIHGKKYNYDKVEYVNSNTKVEIICPKHGSFWQKSYSHLHGHGCPTCNASKGEKEVKRILDKNSILYEQQKTFPECKNKFLLPFDFYLPEFNILIEYDGIQHYEVLEFFGGEEAFKETQKRDEIKSAFAEKYGIKLLRIKYDEDIYNSIKKYSLIKEQYE